MRNTTALAKYRITFWLEGVKVHRTLTLASFATPHEIRLIASEKFNVDYYDVIDWERKNV